AAVGAMQCPRLDANHACTAMDVDTSVVEYAVESPPSGRRVRRQDHRRVGDQMKLRHVVSGADCALRRVAHREQHLEPTGAAADNGDMFMDMMLLRALDLLLPALEKPADRLDADRMRARPGDVHVGGRADVERAE